MSTILACSAAARSSSPAPAGAAASTMRRSPVPSSTATSSRKIVGAGSPRIRDAKSSCSRVVSGRTPVGWWRGGSLSPSAIGNSNSASGLPWASVINRSRTRGANAGNRCSSNSTAAARSSGSSSNAGKPARSKKHSVWVRSAARKPTRVPSSRRAAEASTSELARSSHGRSSTITSNGRADAESRSNPRTAFETTSRSAGSPPSNPSATLSAWRYNGGSAASPSRRGCNT